MCKEYSAFKVPARAQKANGSPLLPLKNQRLSGARIAWAPKKISANSASPERMVLKQAESTDIFLTSNFDL